MSTTTYRIASLILNRLSAAVPVLLRLVAFKRVHILAEPPHAPARSKVLTLACLAYASMLCYVTNTILTKRNVRGEYSESPDAIRQATIRQVLRLASPISAGSDEVLF